MKAVGSRREEGFRVGPWRVRPDLHRLSRDGSEVRVEPKVMEVLTVLAARPGEVVSRQELQDAVWGARHLSEELPRRAISALRKVFGEDPRQPRYIETIPRAGYRLIAPVTPLPNDGRPNPVMEHPVARPGRQPSGHRAVGAVAVGALLLGTVLWIGLGTRGAPEGAAGPRTLPVTGSPGLEYDPALSPDGTRVAYLRAPSIDHEAGVDLQVRLLEADSTLTLTERPAAFDEPIESPTWSPDGTSIAYLRWRRGEGWGVYRIPALGGAERKILDLPGAGAAGLSWSPDGRSLAVGLRPSDDGPFAIHRILLSDLRIDRLSSPPPATIGDRFPVWSPDGKRIAFLRTERPDASAVWLWSRDEGERVALPGRRKIADLDWRRDGSHLLLAVHEDGRHRVRVLNLERGTSRRYDGAGDDARWLSASRRDDRLLVARTRWTFGIWRYDGETGAAESLPELSSTFFDEGLDLSPDGTTLALISTRSGAPELWLLPLGASPTKLTAWNGIEVARPCWAPSGDALVFEASPDGQSDLFRIDRAGGPPTLLTPSEANEAAPLVSRDGKTLYFASDRDGSWQLWSRPLDGGEARQLTTEGGFRARESADGRALIYSKWRQTGLWRLSLEDGTEERLLTDEPKVWEGENWRLRDDRIVLVTRDEAGRERLSTFEPATDRWTRQTSLTGTPVQPSLALAADGTAFLVQLDRIESDLTLVEPDASGR